MSGPAREWADPVAGLVRRARRTKHGFTDLKRAADDLLEQRPVSENIRIARRLYASDVAQARMLATRILGGVAARSASSLLFLRRRISQDGDWRVHEMLAQGFDRFCADRGYERARPVILAWLRDREPNVRRAASEGLRIWTARPYFREHPQEAIRWLSKLRADPSEYVRKSVGNALRDISRMHRALVYEELREWDRTDERVAQTHSLAARFLRGRSK